MPDSKEPRGRILVLMEDRDPIAEELDHLHQKGHELTLRESLVLDLDFVRQTPLDVILISGEKQEHKSLDLVREIKDVNTALPIVFFSVSPTKKFLRETFRVGAYDHVIATPDREELVRTIARAVRFTEAEQTRLSHLQTLSIEMALEFPADLDAMKSVLDSVLTQADLLGYSRERWQMRLGVSEALHNALTHGCRNDKDLMIRLEMKADRRSACFSVEDAGSGFDVESSVNAFNPEENIYSGSGRGLYLIRHCMDEVQWNEKGNRVTMIKKMKNDEGEARDGL